MASVVRPRAALVGVPLAALIATAHLANDAFSNILPAYLPTLQARFGLGEVALASLVALISLSANVLQPFMGAFTDRWGRRRAAALGLLLSSGLMSFIAVSTTVWSLVAMLAIGGLGSAIFHPGAVAMMRDTGPRKSLAVGLFAASGALGSAIMPVVVLFILRSYGPEYIPFLAIIGALLAAALFFGSPPQPTPKRSDPIKVFDRALFFGPVGLLSLAGILRASAFVSFSSAMPLYLVNVKGVAPDAALIGLTLMVYGFASAAAGMLGGALEGSIGRVRLVGGSMLLAAPTLSLVLLLEPGSLGYFAAIAVGALLTNASLPVLIVSAQDLAPHAVGTASGMQMGFTWGIAGVLYIGFGALQAAIGLSGALLISFSFLWPAAWVAMGVLHRHRDVWAQGKR
jgi:FSR family fosmidomycin resistance protein-like MFS transporter